MRENTGRRTVQTINFVNGQSAEGPVWTPEQADEAEWTVRDMAQAHLEMLADAGETGAVWEYEVPGLLVVALVSSGVVDTVIYISEDDLARVHTALRTGREMTIRYVKTSGEVSRRRVRPQSLVFTKGRDYLLRAEDDRRDGETRSFRWDRVTHTTLHRRVRRAAPSKSALVAQTGAVRTPETVQVQNWDGAPKLITREAYDRLLAARDPREPKAVDEAIAYA